MPRKLSILIAIFLLGSHLSTCKKILDSNYYQLNSENLQTGIVNYNSEIVCTEITKLLLDLKSKPSADDKFGHAENLNKLIDRINSNCRNVAAELLCYACIYTLPPQSELKLSTDSSGVEVARVLDISTPEDDILSCVRLHRGYFEK